MRAILTWIALASTVAALTQHERFDEELTLTPLKDGKLLAHFNFTTLVQVQTPHGAPLLDYHLFPKAIGEVLQQYNVREVHLTFTQGRWNHDTWGYPPSLSSGTGVEMYAWMKRSDKIDTYWQSLGHTLGGLFCASLNTIDMSLTSEPRLSFRPINTYPFPADASDATESSHQLRYGVLAHEGVCTENLTPWIKLLPCKAKSGIAVLLNPYKIYDSHFHSMAIHAGMTCTDETCDERVFSLQQTVTVVVDPMRVKGKRDWQLSSVFHRTINNACPLAHESHVRVAMDSVDQTTLTPRPATHRDGHAIYDLLDKTPGDLSMSWDTPTLHHAPLITPPIIHGRRHITGYGQERGGLTVTIHNESKDKTIPVIYFDSIPWFLRLYLHTLRVEILGEERNDIIGRMFYQPALDRSRPAMLECELLIPPQSIVTLSLEFDKAFLKYTEHRPDANRGFDLGPAVLTIEPSEQGPLRIYTGALLVSLPTPDFSMPYNVITLTCTVIALFFGSILNLLVRSFRVISAESTDEKGDKLTKKNA